MSWASFSPIFSLKLRSVLDLASGTDGQTTASSALCLTQKQNKTVVVVVVVVVALDTDVRRASSLNAPYPGDGDIITQAHLTVSH